MGIGNHPDVHGEDWHCARCGLRSGMYGHRLDDGWYCADVAGFGDVQRARAADFDVRAAARLATVSRSG